MKRADQRQIVLILGLFALLFIAFAFSRRSHWIFDGLLAILFALLFGELVARRKK